MREEARAFLVAGGVEADGWRGGRSRCISLASPIASPGGAADMPAAAAFVHDLRTGPERVGLGILCPGQGAQHSGMLDPIRGEPEAERVLALASTLLEALVVEYCPVMTTLSSVM